ncbi:AsmA family protein [Cryomorphaceae bacterium]|nr:AsmA family protein [Cryomorphaceae bacterium]
MRIVRKILTVLLILMVLALAGGWIITTQYGDQLVGRVTQALNDQLRTEVTVEEIDLTLWRRFPNAALRFQNVFIPVPESSDTLIAVDDLYLEVNLFNLIRGQYIVDGLTLSSGVAYPDRDPWGRPNYLILKATENETEADFQLDLQKVRLNNMRVRYTDRANELIFEGTGLDADVSGNFSAGRFELETSGKGQLVQTQFQETSLPTALPLSWSLRLDVSGDTVLVDRANLEVDGMPFKANGGYRPELVDLYLTGDDLNLEHLLSRLPERFTDHFQGYEAQGTFYFRAHLMGDPQKRPRLYADFHVNNGRLYDPSSKQTLQDLEIEGRYDDGAGQASSAVLELTEFSGTAQGSTFLGTFSMSGFESPLIKAELKADLDLEQISAFLPPTLSRELYGSAQLDLNFENRFYRLDEVQQRDLVGAKMNGSLELNSVQWTTDYLKHPVQGLTGRFTFTNRDLRIERCSGRVSESDFEITGYFRNTLAYALIPGEPVALEAEFKSQNLQLDDLLADSESESEYSLELSPRVSYDLNVDVANLGFEKFTAQNIRGRFIQKAGVLRAQPLTFQAVDGSFKGRMVVNGRDPQDLQVLVDAEVTDIDIRRLFDEFNNFGQTTLASDNLRGRTDASIQFNSYWSPQLVADLDRLTTTADLTIRNGALIGFEPLKALGDFVEVEELENVEFQTLRNRIEIRRQTILIPDMSINSSALDFAGNGTHTFDNQIDYHVRMRLSDVLVRKQQKERPDLEEHYVFEDSAPGPLLFLTMTGDVYSPTIKYDAKSASKNIAAEFKNEGQEIKEAFQSEFKPDTTTDKTQEEPDFIIEWNEEEEPDTLNSPNFYDF